MTHTLETVLAPHDAVVDRTASGCVRATVNGERRELPAGATIADLLALHGLDPRLVVVEHNREILRDRGALASITLAEGDVVEIVHFVGGG
jgi:thiamine biosynthesis protein ThiS